MDYTENTTSVNRKLCKIKYCKTCDSILYGKDYRKTYCSHSCRPMKQYRNMCKFRISKRKYPKLFKQDLIDKYGKYKAASKGKYNPEGVTWDHLYRVEEGHKNNVDPKILSHPANAEMVQWTENIKRRTSMISLEELLDRIENWKEVYENM